FYPKDGETRAMPVSSGMLYQVIKICIQDESGNITEETIRVLLDRLVNAHLFGMVGFSERFVCEKTFQNNSCISFVPRLIDGVVDARLFAEKRASDDSGSVRIHYVSDENFVNL